MSTELASMPIEGLPSRTLLLKQQTLSSTEELSSSEASVDSDDDSVISQLETPEAVTTEILEVSRSDARRTVLDQHIKRQQEGEQHQDVDAHTVGKEQKEYSADIEAESARIIDKVRDYQQELFERAKSENIIAVYVHTSWIICCPDEVAV